MSSSLGQPEGPSGRLQTTLRNGIMSPAKCDAHCDVCETFLRCSAWYMSSGRRAGGLQLCLVTQLAEWECSQKYIFKRAADT